MKNFRYFLISIIFALICMTPVFAQDTADPSQETIDPQSTLTYQAHCSDIGWQDPVKNGEVAGTTGKAKKVECLKINTNLDPEVLGVSYTPHVADVGWTEAKSDGQEAGTVGKNRGIEALRISLTGSQAANYDIYYRVHAANLGWLGWAANGADAGTTGCAFPVEALEIQILPKNSQAPGTTENALVTRDDFALNVRSHVENIGWTDPVKGGVTGTTGKALKLEAVEAQISDPLGKSGIVGQAHVENIGWQKTGEPNTAIGTTGQNLQIEALNFRLTGPAAQIFDLNYRVHAANIGWMPWTANGQAAGTSNGALRLEAVEIVLKPKGAAAVEAGAFKTIQRPNGIIPPAPTCITISIGKQRMSYYENYDLIVDTNVVTGMRGIDDTKVGDWSVLEKLTPYRTVGPGYDAVTNYWLTLYRGDIYGFGGEGHIVDRVGIHDASWRSDWGTSAYTRNGSHGCVNTPLAAMRTIFTRVPQGVPVRIR